MLAITIFLIVIAAEILLIAIVAFLLIFFYLRTSLRRSEQNQKIYYEFLRRADTLTNDIVTQMHSSQINARDSYYMVSQLVESTRQELPNLLSQGIQDGLIQGLNKSTSSIGTGLVDSSEQKLIRASDQNTPLIRELSHALNTPLSQMEAATLIIKSKSGNQGLINLELSTTAESIQTSINICKSVLLAYRELILVAKSSSDWSPKSLWQAILSASQVYADKYEIGLKFEVDLPSQIKGYSNNYLVALLLPIIENAVEASKPNSEVSIRGRRDSGNYFFEITNAVSSLSEADKMYNDGFSSKMGHTGVGLSIVQHLLTAYRGASLSHSYKNGLVTFRIGLPFGD